MLHVLMYSNIQYVLVGYGHMFTIGSKNETFKTSKYGSKILFTI